MNKTNYDLLTRQIEELAEIETHYIPFFSNASALLWEFIKDINWVGFYLIENGSLMLGPFQGKLACFRIKIGKGVCGTAVSEKKSQVVEDVHKFPGHIACDSASNSEVVIPLWKDNKIIGVLDIDSPEFGRFSDEDREGLEKFCKKLMEVVKYPDKI